MKIKKIIDAISGNYNCPVYKLYKHLPKVREFEFYFEWGWIYLYCNKLNWRMSFLINNKLYDYCFRTKKIITNKENLLDRKFFTENIFDCLDIIDEFDDCSPL